MNKRDRSAVSSGWRKPTCGSRSWTPSTSRRF